MKRKAGTRRAQKVYCTCKTDGNDGKFMVACDGCDGWFHPGCIGTTKPRIDRLTRAGLKFLCPECSKASSSELHKAISNEELASSLRECLHGLNGTTFNRRGSPDKDPLVESFVTGATKLVKGSDAQKNKLRIIVKYCISLNDDMKKTLGNMLTKGKLTPKYLFGTDSFQYFEANIAPSLIGKKVTRKQESSADSNTQSSASGSPSVQSPSESENETEDKGHTTRSRTAAAKRAKKSTETPTATKRRRRSAGIKEEDDDDDEEEEGNNTSNSNEEEEKEKEETNKDNKNGNTMETETDNESSEDESTSKPASKRAKIENSGNNNNNNNNNNNKKDSYGEDGDDEQMNAEKPVETVSKRPSTRRSTSTSSLSKSSSNSTIKEENDNSSDAAAMGGGGNNNNSNSNSNEGDEGGDEEKKVERSGRLTRRGGRGSGNSVSAGGSNSVGKRGTGDTRRKQANEEDEESGKDSETGSGAVWNGTVEKSVKKKFGTFRLSGKTVFGSEDAIKILPPNIEFIGRLKTASLIDYLKQLASSDSRRYSILRIEPERTPEEIGCFNIVHKYFIERQRSGSLRSAEKVTTANTPEEIYLLPLGKDDALPDFLIDRNHLHNTLIKENASDPFRRMFLVVVTKSFYLSQKQRLKN